MLILPIWSFKDVSSSDVRRASDSEFRPPRTISPSVPRAGRSSFFPHFFWGSDRLRPYGPGLGGFQGDKNVDGQATESLAVRADGTDVVFLAQATAPLRTELASKGGIAQRSASGSEEILTEAEIAQLVELARRAPSQFPSLREDGEKPADIEFAFKDGKLALLQLRPFVESKAARGNAHLSAMDRKIQGSGIVDLGE